MTVESAIQHARRVILHGARVLILAVLTVTSITAVTGCASPDVLMPTPNLYATAKTDPFADVPPAFQNNHVDVLYLTDCATEGTTALGMRYGYQRSRSVAFGVSQVEFGKDVSWKDLVAASRAEGRKVALALNVPMTKELTLFPPTPRSLVEMRAPSTRPISPLALLGDVEDEPQLAAEAIFKRELAARLAMTPQKEVYLFVHGYNNTFYDAVKTIAQLWHFFGRQGVPVAYSWPAGGSGLLRGYTYDSASSEFTVFHLKQMIRLIASCPDVKKINIIAHSRGTDTTINALRELFMEIHGSGRNSRQILKLGTLVLAAPDIDVDVVIQKVTTVRLGHLPERIAMYVCSKDKALGLSAWLFGGLGRLGELKPTMFTQPELDAMRASKTTQLVDVRTTQIGPFGHDYFHSSSAVSSDIILLMRYHLLPGADTGRPLRATKNGFWAIDDGYPGKDRDLPPTPADSK